jgi:hypothetical protein
VRRCPFSSHARRWKNPVHRGDTGKKPREYTFFAAPVTKGSAPALFDGAMTPDPTTSVIIHAIQLAVAPVFLLTGIAALLGVMTNRLARVIDRARALEQVWGQLDEHARVAGRSEFLNLERRRHLASWSINFCTCAALIVCAVIVTLFVEEFFQVNLKWFAGGLFVCAMIALMCGLFAFLREVYLATHTVRIDVARFGG